MGELLGWHGIYIGPNQLFSWLIYFRKNYRYLHYMRNVLSWQTQFWPIEFNQEEFFLVIISSFAFNLGLPWSPFHLSIYLTSSHQILPPLLLLGFWGMIIVKQEKNTGIRYVVKEPPFLLVNQDWRLWHLSKTKQQKPLFLITLRCRILPWWVSLLIRGRKTREGKENGLSAHRFQGKEPKRA